MPRDLSDDTISVFLVDDHPGVLEALTVVVEAAPELSLAGQAANAETAIDALDDDVVVDLVLLDVQLPGMSGVEASIELGRRRPDLTVALMSTLDAGDLPSGWDDNVAGFLPKLEIDAARIASLATRQGS